ncbi:AraC family transcriptional regulator [Chitinophaga sp. Cy-1792]|uniref:helix-turn-helix domain-containing protein n=1 Tax=Chitinophaga sp. Cy-1792 TaxID=2608339 RepID=UPI00141E6D25|nr:AraC family transcriptional regulator [Chitinophaga sp. Cy-1792]NIG54831.1 helix-turn-helix transcriptional regulator [Chitinophaga sp. Cy-1792]
MKSSRAAIPRYKMPVEAKAGMQVHSHDDPPDYMDHDIYAAHRDEHYLMFFSYGGGYKANVDFRVVHRTGQFIGLIVPGQVHQLLEAKAMKGYSVTFDPSLMPVALKSTIEAYFKEETVFGANDLLMEQTEEMLEILMKLRNQSDDAFTAFAMHSILQGILGLVAGSLEALQSGRKPDNRAAIINREFQLLVQEHFKDWKSPADYAKVLHITATHLNDTIKDVTGIAVSQHIQQQVILEAKRLLYHTHLTVTEIAYELGYEDVGYFTRMFKKIAGMTALSFRKSFRE